MKFVFIFMLSLFSFANASLPNECQDTTFEENYKEEIDFVEKQRLNYEFIQRGFQPMLVTSSKTLGFKNMLWIDIKTYDERDLEHENEEAKIEDVIHHLNDYFVETSGGKLVYNISRTVYVNEAMNRTHCNSYSGFCESAVTVGYRATRAIDPYNDYDIRVLNFYRSCNCMRFAGFASVGGRDSWINRASALIAAHEIGHNHGLHHHSYRTSEYGGRLSVMGSYIGLPDGHYTVGAKAAHRWLTGSQIKHIKDKTGGVFWLQSHDTGVYNNDKVYAVKIHLDTPGKFLWLEYRSKYTTTKGLHAIWAIEMPQILLNGENEEDYFSVYGYSQQMDYLSGTYTLTDSKITGGYVYDITNVGAYTQIVQQNETAIKLNITFIEKPVTFDNILQVNTTESFNISEFKLYKINIDHPSPLIIQTICTIEGNADVDSGIYIYNNYPYMFLKTGNPLIGATFRTYMCKNGKYFTNSIVDHYDARGDRYETFTSDVYVLLYAGNGATSVGSVKITQNYPYYCNRNYYKENNVCKECPAGKFSTEASISDENCYENCDTVKVTSVYYSYMEGLYTKVPDRHYNGFYYFLRKNINGDVEYALIKSFNRWGIISKYVIDRGWWSFGAYAESNSEHPTGIINDANRLIIECANPTLSPSHEPTKAPTLSPSHEYEYETSSPTTKEPTSSPSHEYEYEYETSSPTTKEPTSSPSHEPTKSPSYKPTKSPLHEPTKSPSYKPTSSPSHEPTKSPSYKPTSSPSHEPTKSPSYKPTSSPSHEPTKAPSLKPTEKPSCIKPTISPSRIPTTSPTMSPSDNQCRNNEYFPPNGEIKYHGNLMIFSENRKRVWGGRKPLFRTAHANITVNSGVHEWKFYMHKLTGGEHSFFGITNHYNKRFSTPCLFKHGFGYRGIGDKCIESMPKRWRRDRELVTGDTLTMVFNTTDGSLHYTINNLYLGMLHSGIPTNYTYHMFFTLTYNYRADVEVLSHKCIY